MNKIMKHLYWGCQLLLIGLKLTGVITFNWFLVLLPLMFVAFLFILILIGIKILIHYIDKNPDLYKLLDGKVVEIIDLVTDGKYKNS